MLSVNLDVSCLGNQQLTGIGNYAKNLISHLGNFPDITMSGSYKISRWKKAKTIAGNVPFRTFAYWPLISDIKTQDFDIYHGLDFFIPASRRFKKIVTVHDLAIYQSELWDKKNLKASIANFENMLFKNKPDHIITVSEFVKTELTTKFPQFEGMVTAIHHGADHFQSLDHDLPNYPFPYIFFLGTVEIRKNVIGLVNAFNLLADSNPDIHLIIAGQPGYRAEEVKTAIDKSPFKSRILWHEKILDNEVQHLMKSCTVFCYPSFYEGFGIPLVEAMSLGIPIVTSNSGAMKEIAGNAAEFFDPNGPPENLAKVLSLVISDSSLRSQLNKNGVSRKNEFTWAISAEKTIEVYKKVIGW